MVSPESFPLDGWENFYVIVGSAAGGLTGLMFVVVTLLAERRRATGSSAHQAYASPVVFHFTTVLLISGLLTMPAITERVVALTIGAFGVGGAGYLVRTVRRMRAQESYEPERSDWLWYAIVPAFAYVVQFSAAVVMEIHHETTALYAVAVTTLILLVVGIRNAWDSATYIAVQTPTDGEKQVTRDG